MAVLRVSVSSQLQSRAEADHCIDVDTPTKSPAIEEHASGLTHERVQHHTGRVGCQGPPLVDVVTSHTSNGQSVQ